MDWSDEAIVLSVRPHGETSAIAEIFTRDHGRYLGLVRGGRSRRLRPVLQVGNLIDVTWKARLESQLGFFTMELSRGFAAEAMDQRMNLAGLASMCELARLLPEREPIPGLYEVTGFVLSFFDNREVWPALLVRWEQALLEELGFGLDLSTCASTGGNDRLIYVSPKSGRAVSASAGEPYRDKLLSLPEFLRPGGTRDASRADVVDGLMLTGHFLEKHIFEPRGALLPESRQRLLGYLKSKVGNE